MSKEEKLRARFNRLPKDFTWDELVTLLDRYGFFMLSGSGSRRKFINYNKRVISVHCPHPDHIVKPYVLKEIKTILEEVDNGYYR